MGGATARGAPPLPRSRRRVGDGDAESRTCAASRAPLGHGQATKAEKRAVHPAQGRRECCSSALTAVRGLIPLMVEPARTVHPVQPYSTRAVIDGPGSHQAHTLRNGVRAHALTREERARGGRVKAARNRHHAEMADCADRIVWTLARVGEDDAARAVQQYFLPHAVDGPWTRKSPLEKANARIAKLEALVEEMYDDAKLDMIVRASLGTRV